MNTSHSSAPSGSGGGSVTVSATTSGRRGGITSNTANAGTVISSSKYTISGQEVRKLPPTIDTFWPNIMSDVRNIKQVDAKHQSLPLARIKKIMKLDENAKMIAAEAPLLFAKACEYFIQELTMRAWIHTEESKRRTLQRSDIAQAIANYDQFDFLIDIVPREDIKPSAGSHKKETQLPASSTTSATTSVGVVSGTAVKVDQNAAEMLNFNALTADALAAASMQQPQQQTQTVPQPQQLQIIQQATAQPQQMQYFITTPDALAAAHTQQGGAPQQQLQIIQQAPQPQYFITAHQPQQLILTAGPNGQLTATPAPATAAQQQQTTLLQNLAQQQQHQQHQQQQQQIQLLQHVVTPTGELTNVPIAINANSLNLLRLQMQPTAQQLLQLSTATNTPVTTTAQVVQQHHHQQQQHQQHHHANANTNIFINATHHNQHQQHGNAVNNSIVSTDRNLGSTFRPNC